MHCWLNINKPLGISSSKVVSYVKKLLKVTKAGHCGTLDVEAEGVLPVGVGEATKLISLLIDTKKEYIFTIQFGAKTDTADSSGNIIDKSDYMPSYTEVISICKKFVGDIIQTPPSYSAIKINGTRSYILARRGVPVVLKPRVVTIFHFQCINFNQGKRRATYIVECSKGTYIRSLVEDVALSLQSLGFMLELKRTKVGLFKIEDSIKISDIANILQSNNEKSLYNLSIDVESVLSNVPFYELSVEEASRVRCGQKITVNTNNNFFDFMWVKCDDKLVAIGNLVNGFFVPSRVFNLI